MDKKQKAEWHEMFAEAFQGLVVPLFKDLKKDISSIKKDVAELKETTRRIENKVEKQATRVDDHEGRIQLLEEPPHS